jgi:hypothetical protein
MHLIAQTAPAAPSAPAATAPKAAEPMGGGPALAIALILLAVVATVSLFFPAVRKRQALFGPAVVIVTVAVTVVAVGALMVVMYRSAAS